MAPDGRGGLPSPHWMDWFRNGECLERDKVQVWLCSTGRCRWSGEFSLANIFCLQMMIDVSQPLAGNTGWTSCGNALPPNVVSESNRWNPQERLTLASGSLSRSKLMAQRISEVLSCSGQEYIVSLPIIFWVKYDQLYLVHACNVCLKETKILRVPVVRRPPLLPAPSYPERLRPHFTRTSTQTTRWSTWSRLCSNFTQTTRWTSGPSRCLRARGWSWSGPGWTLKRHLDAGLTLLR